jgi:VIT1/CCC1 family predicted Fe2+/Mn2+ transporter
MQTELLIWAAVILAGLALVWLFFWIARLRQRRKWRSKRPIHVDIRKH